MQVARRRAVPDRSLECRDLQRLWDIDDRRKHTKHHGRKTAQVLYNVFDECDDQTQPKFWRLKENSTKNVGLEAKFDESLSILCRNLVFRDKLRRFSCLSPPKISELDYHILRERYSVLGQSSWDWVDDQRGWRGWKRNHWFPRVPYHDGPYPGRRILDQNLSNLTFREENYQMNSPNWLEFRARWKTPILRTKSRRRSRCSTRTANQDLNLEMTMYCWAEQTDKTDKA